MGYYVNSFDVDLHLKDAPADFLDELEGDGFHFDAWAESNLIAIYSIDGKWSYIEEALLKLAPYVVEPGYIYFSGEDYEQFRVVFDDSTMSIYDAKVVYNTDPTTETRY